MPKEKQNLMINRPADAALLEINYDGIEPASYIVQIDETTIRPSTVLTTTEFLFNFIHRCK